MRKTNIVQIIGHKFRENIRKEAMASMKNVAPGKLELVIGATEPLVDKYMELLAEMFCAMCTPSMPPVEEDDMDEASSTTEELQREIGRLREVVELKTEQVRILREQALAVYHRDQ